jgi:hypothetical protein
VTGRVPNTDNSQALLSPCSGFSAPVVVGIVVVVIVVVVVVVVVGISVENGIVISICVTLIGRSVTSSGTSLNVVFR